MNAKPLIRICRTKEWGIAVIRQGHYEQENGNLAVWIEKQGEVLAKLSVNLPESDELPENCFYLKWWGENYVISMDAVESGWLKVRDEFPLGKSGKVTAIPVFELLNEQMAVSELKEMIENWQAGLQGENS